MAGYGQLWECKSMITSRRVLWENEKGILFAIETCLLYICSIRIVFGSAKAFPGWPT